MFAVALASATVLHPAEAEAGARPDHSRGASGPAEPRTRQRKNSAAGEARTRQHNSGGATEARTRQRKNGGAAEARTRQHKSGGATDAGTRQQKGGGTAEARTRQRKNGRTAEVRTQQRKNGGAAEARTRQHKNGGRAEARGRRSKSGAADPSARPARARASGGGGGAASWYGAEFHGRRTANGERYDMDGLTAAHRSLPFGTQVRVTNRSNGRSVVVRINDRGPFHGGRVIDLSRGAASRLGMVAAGTARVSLEVQRR